MDPAKAQGHLPRERQGPSTSAATTFLVPGLHRQADRATSKRREVGQAFFAYLAFTAPTGRCTPDADIAKYEGRYKEGYDKLRQSASSA